MKEPIKESLGKAYGTVRDDLDSMESVLEGLLSSSEPRMRLFVDKFGSYRGKRVRPALLLLFGHAFGRVDLRHVRAAAAAELLHVATLIHDDILDEASVRRRSDTANALWGNELSVLLGDWVFAAALEAACGIPERWVASNLVSTAREVCQGEMLQICHRHDVGMSEERYLEIVGMKTGALFGFCCETGARLSGAPQDASAACGKLGRDMGVAFQIVDDCLDVSGSEDVAGKSLGTDVAKGKMTLPVIRALALAQGAEKERLAESFRGGSEPEWIRSRILESGALEWSGSRARAMTSGALDSFRAADGVSLNSGLEELAEFMLGRSW